MKALSLPADVKALLRSGYNTSVDTNSQDFAESLQRLRDSNAEWLEGWEDLKSMTAFQLSVRLLGVLGELETTLADSDFEGHVTASLTCEYHIYVLNRTTPLQYNPFLHHWVFTCAGIQQSASEQEADLVPWQWKARHEILKLALTSPDALHGITEAGSMLVEARSPEVIIEQVKNERLQPIDLAPFARMLVKQGLPMSEELSSYFTDEDPLAAMQQLSSLSNDLSSARDVKSAQDASLRELLRRATESSHHRNTSTGSQLSDALLSPHEYLDKNAAPTLMTDSLSSKGKLPASTTEPITSHSSLATVRQALVGDPEETSRALTRLPLDLPSLELLTQLIEGGILADTSTVAREYIQHCLRIAERLGATFSPASDSGNGATDEAILQQPGGREEQIRAVKLLVLFVKNLLRKGLLPLTEVAFDLEEICVRYIWIGEVREFRKFLEGGEEMVDAAPAPAAGG